MFKTKIVHFDDLSEEQKEVAPDNGDGKVSSYLKIYDETGASIFIRADGSKPEGEAFTRDLEWMKEAIEFALGEGVPSVT